MNLTSPADTLVCDTAQIALWQSDPAYNYNRELITPEMNVFEWISRQFGELLRKIFGSHFAEEYSGLILVCIAILLLLLIVWFVYRKRPELFMASHKNALSYTVEEDTIYGVDFPGGIAEALSRQNYREAVRLLYLQTLKQLSDAERIDWQLYKTPTQYINQERLKYAVYLLAQTDREILDICECCGFSNVSHFYHLFREQFGVSPAKFRKTV